MQSGRLPGVGVTPNKIDGFTLLLVSIRKIIY